MWQGGKELYLEGDTNVNTSRAVASKSIALGLRASFTCSLELILKQLQLLTYFYAKTWMFSSPGWKVPLNAFLLMP